MSDIANNVIRSNKHWRHIALTFMCMLMLILSFCLVVNAENGETNTEEVAGNETAVQSEQSENVSEPQNETNSEEATQATDYSHETRSAAYAAGNEAVSETPVAGVWKKEVGGWRFYNKSGAIQRGFCYIEGKKYYFGPNDGLMKTGWQIINRSYYYFGAADDGAMKTGWEKIGGYWYHFETNGAMSYGLTDVGSSTYYFGKSTDGAMKISWQLLYNCYYYFGGANDGAMKQGWQYIGGYWYHFGETGYMETGVQTIAGKNYYFGSADDGAMKTGWQKIGAAWLYLGDAGDGAAKTGWQQVGGCWYYFDKYGIMKTGWQSIAESLYYLGGANEGIMRTGWQQIESKWYYFNGSGAAETGWQQIGGYWYYFENNHILVSDAVKQIDGHTYVFNADGVMQANEFTFKGKRYFADASGAVIEINEINDVIKYGLKFLGENGNRFNDWYYNGNTKYRSLAWCNTFVSYVMSKCGINFKSTAYVPHAEQWMHSNYKWVDYKDAKAGDVIIFCWSGKGNNSGSGNRDHIGFLISRNPDGTFTTLEGNTSGGIVAIRTRYAKNIRNIFNPRR